MSLCERTSAHERVSITALPLSLLLLSGKTERKKSIAITHAKFEYFSWTRMRFLLFLLLLSHAISFCLCIWGCMRAKRWETWNAHKGAQSSSHALPIETYAFWIEREWNRIMWRLLLTICVNEKDEQLIAFISCQLQMMHAIVHRHFILRFMCSKLVEIMCTIALSLPTSHQVNTYFYNRSTLYFPNFWTVFHTNSVLNFRFVKKSVERRKMNAPNPNNVRFPISFFDW